MSFRSFIFSLLAFLVLPAFSAGEVKGWIVYITLRLYQAKQTGISQSTGEPIFTASYTDEYYTLVKYYVGSSSPTYQTLGLVQYCDLRGNSPPAGAPKGEYKMYLIQNIVSKRVRSDLDGVDYSYLGDLTRNHPLSVIFRGQDDDPFVYNDNGDYIGINPNFGRSGLEILQGQVSSPGSDAPQYYYYDPDTGEVVITDHPNTYMGTYSYDPETGRYTYTAWSDPNGGSSGSVDLSPLVSAVETQGGLTRDQLVSLLGSSGNSWVYDCKLSVAQLYDLASIYYPELSSGISQLNTDVSSELRNGSEMIVGAIEGINVSPVVNVAAPNVTVNPAEVNIDTSSLAKETTLQGVRSDLSTANNSLSTISGWGTIVQSIGRAVSNIKTKLDTWDQNNNISYSPVDFGDTTPDQELPQGFQDSASSFPSSVSQTLGTLTDWGDNGVPSAFDFNPISRILNTFVGSIPSVGSDDNIMEVNFELPYVGHIQRIYKWSDFPYISEFRQFLLWCLYVFFGIACFKLIHKSIF